MDFQKLARKAQAIYTERGGADAARADATEVENILKSDGTPIEKAKAAAKALKEPGSPGSRPTPTPAETPPE